MTNAGFLFLLAGGAEDGEVVVGATSGDVDDAARAMSAGRASPLSLFARARVVDLAAARRRLEALLAPHRVAGEGPARFRISADDAVSVFRVVAAMFAEAPRPSTFRAALAQSMRSNLASVAGFPVDALGYSGDRVGVHMLGAFAALDAWTGELVEVVEDIAAMSPAGRGAFVTLGWDGVVRTIGASAPDLHLDVDAFDAASMNGRARCAVVVERGDALRCFELATGRQIWRTSRLRAALKEEGELEAIAFSDDGLCLATLSQGVLVVRGRTGGEIGRRTGVSRFAWAPNGQRLAVARVEAADPEGGEGGEERATVSLEDLQRDAPVWSVEVDAEPASLAVTLDGSLVAVNEGRRALLLRGRDGALVDALALPAQADALVFGALAGRQLLAVVGEGMLCQLDVTDAAWP